MIFTKTLNIKICFHLRQSESFKFPVNVQISSNEYEKYNLKARNKKKKTVREIHRSPGNRGSMEFVHFKINPT